MTALAAGAMGHIKGPHIDWLSLSPIMVLGVGALIVLLVGLIGAAAARERIVPVLTLAVLAAAIVLEIARFKHSASIVSGALRIDDLALVLDLLFCVAAAATVLLSWQTRASRSAGEGEYHGLLLFSVMGMAVLVSAQNLITLFLGLELLSIPLYVLCASEFRRAGSLESGLKYLVIGSVGSATLLYGLALIYGATGSTDFSGIAASLAAGGHLSGGSLGDPMLFGGLALVVVGFAFKASVAPFHQWTPDVYEGAPTAITAFMATATKAAALGVFIRFFDVAALGAQDTWAPLLAAVAAVTMIVGNVGALGQSSLKRMLGYSGVAQAGYMLGGVVVASRLGVQATVLYLAFYLAMNMAAFGVICAVESDAMGDDVAGLAGLGSRAPWLAWSLTIAMLALAGIPGTVGFIGKFQLIHALIDGGYTWLAIVLVVGSMISLGYYLRVVAAMWMGRGASTAGRPGGADRGHSGIVLAPVAGGSPEADVAAPGAGEASAEGWPRSGGAAESPQRAFVAVVFAAACVFFGVFPSPLFHLAAHAGQALSGLF